MCPEAGDGRRSKTSFVILFFQIVFALARLIAIIYSLNYLSYSHFHTEF